MYRTDHDVEKGLKLALEHLQRATEGYEGECYDNGESVDQDYKSAFQYFSRANEVDDEQVLVLHSISDAVAITTTGLTRTTKRLLDTSRKLQPNVARYLAPEG